MPISGDGILQADFDAAWATVRLVVDGSMWPSAVTKVTITRQVAGVADVKVRGVDGRPVVGGHFVGSDTEMPLDNSVTYQVQGRSSAGVLVKTVTVDVSTVGAARGLWLKVPGMPDLTVRAALRPVGELSTATIGGVYQIAGGGQVAQTVANWSGVAAESGSVTIAGEDPTTVARIRAALAAGRVLLLQPVGGSDLDGGWYFVSSVSRSNPGGFADYPQRQFVMQVQRAAMPAGDGQGVPGVTWSAVVETYATWADVIAAKATWFDLQRGL